MVVYHILCSISFGIYRRGHRLIYFKESADEGVMYNGKLPDVWSNSKKITGVHLDAQEMGKRAEPSNGRTSEPERMASFFRGGPLSPQGIQAAAQEIRQAI